MTTAAEKLAEFNYTMDQAHAWVIANISNPATVLSVRASVGVTNAMLGEIAGWPGAAIPAQVVQGFFQARGLDSGVLDGAPAQSATVVAVGEAGAYEGSMIVHVIELSYATTQITEIPVTLDLGSVSTADFSSYLLTESVTYNGSSFTVPAGVREFSFFVYTIDDTVDEPQEEYTLTVGGVSTRGYIIDTDEPATPQEGSVLLPTIIDGFAPVLDFNDRTGALATATIRGQVLANANPTITANYWNLFDPARFEGSADGVFTPEELGVSHLGTIAATAENIESLFYGTFIDVSTSIDFEEAGAIGTFFMANLTGIVQRTPSVIDQYVDLFVQATADPAAVQAHPDAALASQLVVGMIGLSAGSGSQTNIFEQLLTI